MRPVIMRDERELSWDGCFNVRDLGGLPTTDGRVTRWGAVVRSEQLDLLSPAGWAALREHGIRTIVDLRNDDERGAAAPPEGLTTVHVPLDDSEDRAFWQHMLDDELDCSPLYYRHFIDRKPQRCAAAVAAVARAEPGGVLVHCAIGRDRTGLVTLLLLALAGVAPEDIAADYLLSAARLPPLFAALGLPDQGPRIDEILARKGTSVGEAVAATLASLDLEAALRAGGLTDDDLAAVRDRLLTPAADRRSGAGGEGHAPPGRAGRR
jgi:protein-tyrosine phosphatase